VMLSPSSLAPWYDSSTSVQTPNIC
jgi:hypothetical protein